MKIPREHIPALADNEYAFLNSGGSGPPTASVMEAMQTANAFHSGPSYLTGGRFFEHLGNTLGSARTSAAHLLNCSPNELALTQCTTHGINLGLYSVDWRRGDEILSCTTEHPGLLVPLQEASRRYGLAVKLLEPPVTPHTLREHLTQRTRLLALSHIDWTTGELLPVEELCQTARENDIITLIDGAQSVGNIAVDIPATGADLYAFTGHKWLLGPEGMGALYVRPDYGGYSVSTGFAALSDHTAFPRDGRYTLFEGARRFEASTMSPTLAAGFARAAADAAERGQKGPAELSRLADLLSQRLSSLPRVRVVSPQPATNGLVSFAVEGIEPPKAVDNLLRAGFILRYIPAPRSHLRASVHLFNTEEELERLCAEVAKL